MFRLKSPEVIQVLQNGTESSNKLNQLKKTEVVVVSVLGASKFHEERGYKRAFRLVLDSFGSPILFNDLGDGNQNREAKVPEETGFQFHDAEANPKSTLGEDIEDKAIGAIDGFYSEEERTLFLHLQGPFDASSLLSEWKLAHNKRDSKDMTFGNVWADIKSKYGRSLLLLFSLSHVMIISSPCCYFDTNYIQLFRIIDSVRLEVLPLASKILGKIEGVSRAWRDHGRLCSPRILFLFQTNTGQPARVMEELPVTNPVKVMQYKLEDEIYHIFRKCRIVTNISANSLFAIPTTHEYVFIYDEGVQEPELLDDVQSGFAHITASFCDKMFNILSNPVVTDYKNVSKCSFAAHFRTVYATNASKHICDQFQTYSDVLSDFRDFVASHTRLALHTGFDDDSKHVSEHKHFFVLPTFEVWRKAFVNLRKFFVDEHHDTQSKEVLSSLYQFNSADTEYLEAQCAKMFPKVYALYLKNLPEIFPEKLHKAKVAHAIEAFVKVSRGPGVCPWITKLIQKCDRYWKRGHQQCEARSLHEHTCCHPLHKFRVEDHLEVIPLPVMDETLREMEHSTGHRFLSYCNCGRRQGSRDEPFTIREANFTFYDTLGQDCCDRLERINFPCYEPPRGFSKSTIHPQEMLLLYQQKLLGLIQQTNYDVPSQELEDELRQEEGLEFENEEEGIEEEETIGEHKNKEKEVPTAESIDARNYSDPVKDSTNSLIANSSTVEAVSVLPRTEEENEEIYKKIKKEQEIEVVDVSSQSRAWELAIKDDVKRSEEIRKEWISNWVDQNKINEAVTTTPATEADDLLKENFFQKLPIKAMALSMRLRPNWEQTSKRLPEHVVTWVNDYTTRRKLVSEASTFAGDVDAIQLDEEQAERNTPAETHVCSSAHLSIDCGNERGTHFDVLPETYAVTNRNENKEAISISPNPESSTTEVPESLVPVESDIRLRLRKVDRVSEIEAKRFVPALSEPLQGSDVFGITEGIKGFTLSDDTREVLTSLCQQDEVTSLVAEDVSNLRKNQDDDDGKGVADVPDTVECRIVAQDEALYYLPGMLHSRSLKGFLPLFSSWSLVCVGSSSLYTHTSGITHQPGFLSGSNTLLPWDKMVKAEAGVSKPIPRLIRGRKPTGRAKRITDEFTVKVFLGIEYECKRGHRFLLEGPDKILHTSGQHGTPNLKEAALVVVASDMPLYFRCPCKETREGTPMIAQLMRIHVITPKAPVHVVLDPKVQPGPPPSPIFFPENKEPIKLKPSSYWILRLPYCYVGDDQVYVPSKDVARYNGRLLKGLLNVESMTPEETNVWEMQNNTLT